MLFRRASYAIALSLLLVSACDSGTEPEQVRIEPVDCDPFLLTYQQHVKGVYPTFSDTVMTGSGLRWIQITNTSGPDVGLKGQHRLVHYSGYLPDGTRFATSCTNRIPLFYDIIADRVVTTPDGQTVPLALMEGVWGMRKGELRRIITTTEAYMDKVPQGVPAGSTLIFDVQMVGAMEPG